MPKFIKIENALVDIMNIDYVMRNLKEKKVNIIFKSNRKLIIDCDSDEKVSDIFNLIYREMKVVNRITSSN